VSLAVFAGTIEMAGVRKRKLNVTTLTLQNFGAELFGFLATEPPLQLVSVWLFSGARRKITMGDEE
jgi:hypothetical protein